MNSFDEILAAIKKSDTFYITGHINPDGDSVGSCECLKLALEQLGKDVTCPQKEENPSIFLSSEPGTEFCFVQVDVQPEYRIPKDALEIKSKAKTSICFDHHQPEDKNCDFVYVDSSASANALIIWEFVKFMNIDITKEIATSAYYGLCSDTNSFRNTNTDRRSFEAASEMMQYGVDASAVAQKLFQSRSFSSFELEKIALDHLYVDQENKFAFSYLTSKNYAEYQATKADSDAIIDLLRELECVDVACVIRQENEGDKIHGSLRSKTNADVSKLAKKHTGGGHKAAAGFTMDETDMDKAIDIVKSQLVDLMQDKI